MAKRIRDLSGKFADELLPDERIVEIIGNVNCSPDYDPNLPAYAALTDRRLLVKTRGLRRKSISVELSQVIKTTVGDGPYFSTLTLSTSAGQRLIFTLIARDKVPVIEAAINAARANEPRL